MDLDRRNSNNMLRIKKVELRVSFDVENKTNLKIMPFLTRNVEI